MDAPGLSFKVKFANGEPDIIVEAQAEATFASLVVQVTHSKPAQTLLACCGCFGFKGVYP